MPTSMCPALAMRELDLKGKTELVRVFAETRHRR